MCVVGCEGDDDCADCHYDYWHHNYYDNHYDDNYDNHYDDYDHNWLAFYRVGTNLWEPKWDCAGDQ